MEISYLEDKNLLAYCFNSKNYLEIDKYIETNKESLTYYFEEKDKLLGYKIGKINQLSVIYQQDYYYVNFYFKNISLEFLDCEDILIEKLIIKLKQDLYSVKGYYILKIPSKNTMLINQFNKHLSNTIFTGGTVCYQSKEIEDKVFSDDEIKIKLLSKEENYSYKDDLKKLSNEAFANYFSQYHISYITRDKAPLIYKNWIEDEMDNKIISAFYEGSLVGFLTMLETKYTFEVILNAVDKNFRNKKIYERMLRKALNIALSNKKVCTISTQMDNFNVQKAWINCGFKPYHSFYLMHFNNLVKRV